MSINLTDDRFVSEVVKGVRKGFTQREFQSAVADKYGVTSNLVYQRYRKLMKELIAEEEQAKTFRKGNVRKMIDIVTFQEKKIEEKKESMIEILERMTLKKSIRKTKYASNGQNSEE